MGKKRFAAILIGVLMMFILSAFLAGCQNREQQINDGIKIIDESDEKAANIDENIEKEFDDGLDEALQELEEAEKI